MSRRKSIVVPEIAHRFPVPNACRIGNLVISGSIQGTDPVSHIMPPGLVEQCSNMFSNMKSVIEAAGGTTDDIIKMTVFIRDRNNREPLNAEWTRMFPDPNSRPARHAQPLQVDGPSLVQCDFIAVIDQ
jgi:2-iminobutanoate/2-iminopropanoate deaminase